jgi:hypothetical protein
MLRMRLSPDCGYTAVATKGVSDNLFTVESLATLTRGRSRWADEAEACCQNRWEFDAQIHFASWKNPRFPAAAHDQISEDGQSFLFECEDESILDVTIVDPGSSVIVRDKNNQVEYLRWAGLLARAENRPHGRNGRDQPD